MAKCVSLHHSPRLRAAAALAFHDETILGILQDSSRSLFPDVRGVTAQTWNGHKRLQLALMASGCQSIRQVQIRNGSAQGLVYFLGAALVPPISPDEIQVEFNDDFGVCCGHLRPPGPSTPLNELILPSSVSSANAETPGSLACHLPAQSDYLVSLSAKLLSKSANLATRRHLLVLAFHDGTPPVDPVLDADGGEVLPKIECFHLFLPLQLDIGGEAHTTPVLRELREAARPFFPESLHHLFERPPQVFWFTKVVTDDVSFLSFTWRNHCPACFQAPQPQVAVSSFPEADRTCCTDGFAPSSSPKLLAHLLTGVAQEEAAMRSDIKNFDMFHATMKALVSLSSTERKRLGVNEVTNIHLYKLDVPGLHEGKPPVFRGDPVYIRPQAAAEAIEMCCCVITVFHSQLVLQVCTEALQILGATSKVHVRFSIDEARLIAMKGVGELFTMESCWNWSLYDLHVPQPPHGGLAAWAAQESIMDLPSRAGRWFGELNEQQRFVVEAVHAMPSGSPPLLLIGPPGTGKSWALAETVCQFLYCHVKALAESEEPVMPKSTILLCAPTDIACDLLVETIHNHLQPRDSPTVLPKGLMIRFNEPRRPFQQLGHRNAIIPYCVFSEGSDCFQYPAISLLQQAVVVVCTLRAAWTLQDYMRGSGMSFDHILIDEAGQAVELETYTAFSLGRNGARIVLAGDPKQLGPICRAAQHTSNDENVELFRQSMLERLSNHPRWQNNSPWIVTLYRNYRSHPKILELLSSTRYDGSLVPCASPDLVCKFENLSLLPRKGFPLLFIGVKGQQMMDMSNENQHCVSRPDLAHSYHNPEEALTVVDLVRKLLCQEQENGVAPVQDDLGIICAFRRQVQKMRFLMRREGFGNVRVGTVEDYQGQQEKILIISTTLTDPSQAASLLDLTSIDKAADQSSSGTTAREDVAASLEACIRARVQRDEVENGSNFPAEQRHTTNIVGNVRRYTVALSRAQCALIVVGCPEVLETSPHWRCFLTYVARHGALQGELPSKWLLGAVGTVAAAGDAAAAEPHGPEASAAEEMASGPAAAAVEPSIAAPTARASPRKSSKMGKNKVTAVKRQVPETLPAERVVEQADAQRPAHAEEAGRPSTEIQADVIRGELAAAEAKVKQLQKDAAHNARLMESYARDLAMLAVELRHSNTVRDEAVARVLEMEQRRQDDVDDLRCVVCMEERKAAAIVPCGHVALCRSCLPMLFQRHDPECPICRGRITNTFFVYI